MVALANAVADPGTVMVVDLDASIAVSTVEGSWWLEDLTGPTLLDRYLLAGHDCMVLLIVGGRAHLLLLRSEALLPSFWLDIVTRLLLVRIILNLFVTLQKLRLLIPRLLFLLYLQCSRIPRDDTWLSSGYCCQVQQRDNKAWYIYCVDQDRPRPKSRIHKYVLQQRRHNYKNPRNHRELTATRRDHLPPIPDFE